MMGQKLTLKVNQKIKMFCLIKEAFIKQKNYKLLQQQLRQMPEQKDRLEFLI
jgi:hypothetical protein